MQVSVQLKLTEVAPGREDVVQWGGDCADRRGDDRAGNDRIWSKLYGPKVLVEWRPIKLLAKDDADRNDPREIADGDDAGEQEKFQSKTDQYLNL